MEKLDELKDELGQLDELKDELGRLNLKRYGTISVQKIKKHSFCNLKIQLELLPTRNHVKEIK